MKYGSVMKASDLYYLLLTTCGLKEQVVCDLHHPCAESRGCERSQQHKMIDFDAVKTYYCSKKKSESLASTDAYTFCGCKYCFIEIKGWKEFLKWHEKKLTDEQIYKQVSKYNLKAKFVDSLKICVGICEDIACKDLSFQNASIVYIVITDIDVNDGIGQLMSDLNFLAETSSDWDKFCNTALRTQLDKVSTSPDLHIEKYYESCKSCDTLLDKLSDK